MDKALEYQAVELFQRREYLQAIEIYTKCLDTAPPNTDRTDVLLNRASCFQKLSRYLEALGDCNEILERESSNEKALWKKTKVMCFQGKFSGAMNLVEKWLINDPTNLLARKEKQRIGVLVAALGEDSDDQSSSNSAPAPAATNSERLSPEGQESVKDQRSSSNSKLDGDLTNARNDVTATTEVDGAAAGCPSKGSWFCGTCELLFEHYEEWDSHSRSDVHLSAVTLKGEEWRHRSPPRGLTSDEYTLCDKFKEQGRCLYGDTCLQAHSSGELFEWKARFEAKKREMKNAHSEEYVYLERLHEKLANSDNFESVIVKHLEIAKIHCNTDEMVTMITKSATHSWMFTVTSKVRIHRLMLLHDSTRSVFFISSVSVGPKRLQKHQNLPEHCQVWMNVGDVNQKAHENVYRIKITFQSHVYGSFRQTVLFDFGTLPVLGHDLQVDSAPVKDSSQLTDKLSDTTRWDENKLNIVDFKAKCVSGSDIDLLQQYPIPRPDQFTMSAAVMEPLSATNYRQRMHDLLSIEEMEQLACLNKFSVKAKLQVVDKFLLIPSSMSTAKYAQRGELFAQLEVCDDLSDDTAHGRLILQSCNSALLAPGEVRMDNTAMTQTVYRILIEDKGRNFVFFRLSAACVKDLKLSPNQTIQAHMQFELNRVPMCDMHYAIDNLHNVETVFPDIRSDNLNWDTKQETLEGILNERQHDAVMAVTSTSKTSLPPILLVGPYGTGKTYTLAQATRHVLKQNNSRVLICTHSNSAADLYIKDHLHPMVTAGHTEARPLRVLYELRKIVTVPDVVLPYCLRSADNMRFRPPNKDDLDKHRVVVVTLGTSRVLCDLNLPTGYFTHIFIDEAAQAMEAESLIPLCMADDKTRIVLAGDHMQLSPEVHSVFARERGLHKSLLERLYELYPIDFPCRIMLCENYRSHQAIIDFTSKLFYSHKLITSGKQLPHPTLYPLTFSTAEGEDVQHANNTGFYNMAEVYEVAERVSELQSSWPSSWGDLNDTSIAVVTPYYDQVLLIRGELRKRSMPRVSVERVLNIQGKQFRAVILSTVRTRHTCNNDNSDCDALDYGFLTNVKLLNTAITRAQSLVLVVGDPVSLCSIGKCRKIWEEFISKCSQNDSLLGVSMEQLRRQFDGIEIKRTYVLNPNAPEFVPNRIRHGVDEAVKPGGVVAQHKPAPVAHKGDSLNNNLYAGAVPFVPVYPVRMPAHLPVYVPHKAPTPAHQRPTQHSSPAPASTKAPDTIPAPPLPTDVAVRMDAPKAGKKPRGQFQHNQSGQYMPGYVPYQPYVPVYVTDDRFGNIPMVPQYYPVGMPSVMPMNSWMSSISRLGAPLIQAPAPGVDSSAPNMAAESNDAAMKPAAQEPRAKPHNRTLEPRPWSPALPPQTRAASQYQILPNVYQMPKQAMMPNIGEDARFRQLNNSMNVSRHQGSPLQVRGSHQPAGPQMTTNVPVLNGPPLNGPPVSPVSPHSSDLHVDRRDVQRMHYKPYSTDVTSRLSRIRKALPDKLSIAPDRPDTSEYLQTPAQMKEFMKLLENTSADAGKPEPTYAHPPSDAWTTDNEAANTPATHYPPTHYPPMYGEQPPSPDNRPTYAGVVRRPAPLPLPQASDSLHMSPSPTTPALFTTTPTRDQVGSDALNILSNINFSMKPQQYYQ